MAALGDDNMQAKANASNAISGPTIDVEVKLDLVTSASINKYSFARPRPISLSSKAVVIDAKTTDVLLGDFRRYNHTAGTPIAANDYTQNRNPTGSTFTIGLTTYIYELNIKELNSATTDWNVDMYLSASDRANQINKHHSWNGAIAWTTVTPLTGHSNQQTQKPVGAFQALVISDVPTAGLTDEDVIYCDVWLGTSGGIEHIRFADTYTDVTIHKTLDPITSKVGPNVSVTGYTFAYGVVTTGASTKASADKSQSNGSTTYGTAGDPLRWYLVGGKGSPIRYYRIGDIDVTVNHVIKNPEGGTTQNTTQIHNGVLNTAGASSNQSDNGTLGSSYSWAFDDNADLEITINDETGITEYDLGEGAP